MINPYRTLRELCGLSIPEFATEAGVQRSVIQNLEDGLFPNVSDNLNYALGKACHEHGVDAKSVLGEWSLDNAYKDWIIREREELQIDWPVLVNWHDGSPFEEFRTTLMDEDNRLSFCRLLKLPPATVMRYETGITLSMPAVIQEALIDTGYPYREELMQMMNDWNAR